MPNKDTCTCNSCVAFRTQMQQITALAGSRPVSKTGCYYCGAKTKTNPPQAPSEKKEHLHSCPERNS